jgi:hypothetical protein
MSPGLQMMIAQDSPYGFRGYAFNDAVCFELASEFLAIPKRKRPSKVLRSFTGKFHKVESDLRGKEGLSPPTCFVSEALYSFTGESGNP